MPVDQGESSSGVALPTVTVRGQAVIRAEPDEAMLWIMVSALEDSPGAALGDVGRRSDAIVRMLDELGVAKSDRSTTGVRFQEEFDHTAEGRRSLGHRASRRPGWRTRERSEWPANSRGSRPAARARFLMIRATVWAVRGLIAPVRRTIGPVVIAAVSSQARSARTGHGRGGSA